MPTHWKWKTWYLGMIFISTISLTTEKQNKLEMIIAIRKDWKDRKTRKTPTISVIIQKLIFTEQDQRWT